MESGVEIVELSGELTLDIKAMIEYSGQGKCREVWCYIDTGVFKKDLRTWAQSRTVSLIIFYTVADENIFL